VPPVDLGVKPDQRRPGRGLVNHRDSSEEVRLRSIGQPINLEYAVGGESNSRIEQCTAATNNHLPASGVQSSQLSIIDRVQLQSVRSNHKMPWLGVMDRWRQAGTHHCLSE
jgi:hypothetical protein